MNKYMSMMKFLIPLGAVLLIAGCATTGPGAGSSAPVYEPGRPVEAGGTSGRAETGAATGAQTPPGTAAVVALVRDSERQAVTGDLTRAAALLERALRIEPRDATLWYRLAKVRVQQKSFRQAESLALKSNTLAGQDIALQIRNWRLIARARSGAGDGAGAKSAEQRAAELASRLP